MRGLYVSVLVLALLGVALATAPVEPPKTCKEIASKIPGIMTVKEKRCNPKKECSQCCDEDCNIVTCNNCDEDCPKQCFDHPKVFDIYVDITCNVDDYWNVECIVCDCPEDGKFDWEAVAKMLKEKLLWQLTESEQCKMGSMFNDFKLTCGLSTKKWKADGTNAPANETGVSARTQTSWPKFFPFQCKFDNWMCIFTDRSFKDVHIRIEKKCNLVGKPACAMTIKRTSPDCYSCDADSQTSWKLSGRVFSTHKTCKEGGPGNKCVKHPPHITIEFTGGCSELCLHADKGESCNLCTDRFGNKTDRIPPLCVSKDLNSGLYYNNCSGD
mmetsp:Transcript_30515/g.116777  ORF Transcript_30515/g.116777 Transcript_30515/m.116777 type:complete len:327 (-) Transcript_30515:124-1104(-)|eukprot:CAMPEP_0113955590 /NCGR_PEP_ID=MMETSP0011_2-20120614/1445_1 /TAXON_ID=101924 /ORGANISM="Rhodosorus marinus" /LENGTH=326 /DNA_ID=CAMNT_0000965351 /DNA_START=23 /DNA_END=1003 /DNA_ORIENTATION=- /assembly_acc=CAM_ASM_000156